MEKQTFDIPAPVYLVHTTTANYIGRSKDGPKGALIILDEPLLYQQQPAKASKNGNKPEMGLAIGIPHSDAFGILPKQMVIRYESVIGPDSMEPAQQAHLNSFLADAHAQFAAQRSGLALAGPAGAQGPGAAAPSAAPTDLAKIREALKQKGQ